MGLISIIDMQSFDVVDTIDVGERPRGFILSADQRHAYICASDADRIQIMDLSNHTIVGDLPAHGLASFFIFKSDQYRTVGNSVLENLQEYLKEESDLLPAREQIEDFLHDVDQLRDDTDRLEARFQQLSDRINDSRQD